MLNVRSAGTDSLSEGYTTLFPKRGAGVLIGVIDTGIAGKAKEDLQLTFSDGKPFGVSSILDGTGHGSAVEFQRTGHL